jgi:hypothetical protein
VGFRMSPGECDPHRSEGSPARPRFTVACLVVALAFTAACGQAEPTRTAGGSLTAPANYGGQHVGGTATGDTEAGAAFARWVLEQDPRRDYITDAVVRGEQNLGVKVRPSVTKGDLQRLMVSLAEGMGKTFPGRPVQVTAFYQSGDKLAQALFDPATGRVDVEFV